MNSPSRGTDRPSSTSTPSARPPPKSSPPELMSPSTATQLVRAVPRPRSCTREGRHRGVRRRLCVVEEDALVAEPRVRGADQRSLPAAQCSKSTPRSTASSLQSTRSRPCLLSCVPLRSGEALAPCALLGTLPASLILAAPRSADRLQERSDRRQDGGCGGRAGCAGVPREGDLCMRRRSRHVTKRWIAVV